MALMAATSKGVRRMLGLSLHGWENAMVVFLIIAGLFALVAGVATWAVVRLQRIEIANTELELQEYKLTTSKEIAVANAVGEAAKTEAARANESTAKLNSETARLTAENLALQKTMLPRRLSVIRMDEPFGELHLWNFGIEPTATELFSGIQKFMGVPVWIQAVPEFEPETFALDLKAALEQNGVKVSLVDQAVTGSPQPKSPEESGCSRYPHRLGSVSSPLRSTEPPLSLLKL
jgi:hypothetical protein